MRKLSGDYNRGEANLFWTFADVTLFYKEEGHDRYIEVADIDLFAKKTGNFYVKSEDYEKGLEQIKQFGYNI